MSRERSICYDSWKCIPKSSLIGKKCVISRPWQAFWLTLGLRGDFWQTNLGSHRSKDVTSKGCRGQLHTKMYFCGSGKSEEGE
jgi:hypothetical protein